MLKLITKIKTLTLFYYFLALFKNKIVYKISIKEIY